MEKFIEYLEKAERKLQTADHMTYITFPLVKEKRLLFKILTELNEVLLSTINAILQYEYLYKRIRLTRDSKENLNIFKEKCSRWYEISEEELNKIIEILKLTQKHKNSPFEFVRKEKVIIMSDNLKTETLTLEKIKEYLALTKKVLKKSEARIKRNF